jgi:hypothetical protein
MLQNVVLLPGVLAQHDVDAQHFSDRLLDCGVYQGCKSIGDQLRRGTRGKDVAEKRPWGGLALALVLLGLGLLWFSCRRMAGGPGPSGLSRITVSRETTWLTEPIGDDGCIDYLAAINRMAGEGVRPEDNAVVPLVEAFGPGFLAGADEEFCARLGIPLLLAEGNYFTTLDRFDKRSSSARRGRVDPAASIGPPIPPADQLAQALLRPWTSREFPLLAQWLAENERHLAAFVAGSRRPRCYWPRVRVAQPPTVAGAAHRLAIHFREAGNALAARAMLRLHAQNLAEAWADLEACHRLGRLSAQGPTIADLMQGFALHGVACQAETAIALHGSMTSAQARKRIQQLKALPPWPDAAEKMDHAERWVLLGTISELAQLGPESNLAGYGPALGIAGLDSPEDGGQAWIPGLRQLGAVLGNAATDWDEALRLANAWMDRIREALAKPDRAERAAAARSLYQELTRPPSDSLLGDFAQAVRSGRSPRKAMAERIVQTLVPRLAPILVILPSSEDGADAQFHLAIVALALAAYRADHGALPETLADLCPNYLAELPRDIHGDGPFQYRRSADGFLLYSVGSNGRDDGGHGRASRFDLTDAADDLVVPWAVSREQ